VENTIQKMKIRKNSLKRRGGMGLISIIVSEGEKRDFKAREISHQAPTL